MKDVLPLSGFMSLIAVCAIFVILCTTISPALKQASLLKGKISAVVTLCVSLLCIMACKRLRLSSRDWDAANRPSDEKTSAG